MKQFNFLSKLSLNERGKVVTRLKPHFTPIHPSWCFVSVLCLLLTFGAGSAWGATYIKVTSFSNLTTGNYVIVGQKSASSYGRLIYGTPDASGQLTYTEHYSELPDEITNPTANEIWKLTVSGSGSSRTVTIYNAGQNKYLNSTTGKLAVSASSANWTSKFDSSFSMYYGSTYYLGVNKNTGSNYWRDYGSSNVYNSEGYVLTLYKEKCTVTLMDDGQTMTQTTGGESFTLPSRTSCTGYTFAGWTKSWTSAQSSWTTTAPTIIPAGSYTPTTNENLYPVYTKTVTGTVFSKYQKVNLNTTIYDGKYLISTGTYTMAGSGKTGASFTPGTTESTAKEYTIKTLGSGVFTIKGPDNKYIGGTSGSTTLSFSTSTPSDNNYKWKYTSTGINFQGQTTRYIRANSTTDFRNYTSSNGSTTYLYKRVETEATTTSYISVTTCGYSITYHCNGASSGCPSDAFNQTSLPATLPTPTKTGFTFGGWYTDASLTTPATAGDALSANADLYAKWTCDVTLNRNGVTETIEDVVEGTALDDIDGTGVQGGCTEWTFVGWSKTQRAAQDNSDEMTLVTTVDGPGPYYAVYSHTESGSSAEETVTETFTNQTSHSSESNWKQILTWEASESNASIEWTTYYGKITSGYAEIRTYSDNEMGYIWTSEPITGLKKIKFKGWHVSDGDEADMVVSYSTDNDTWYELGTHEATSATNPPFSDEFEITSSDPSTAYYLSIDLSNATCPSSSNKKYRIDDIVITTETGSGSTTYYSTTASCCTALGSINGSVSWIKPDTAEITWNNVAQADSTWTLRYKTHAASSWSNAWSAQVAGTSDKITIFSDGGTNNKLKARIGGLSCNTLYDFRLVPKNVSGYCPDSLTMDNNGSGYNSGKWSITKGSETNGTFTIGASSSCSGSSISISASASTGYQFSSWTIAKAGGGNVDPAASSATTSFTMPSDNVTVTAAFSAINYTITYNLNGGTNPGGVPTGFTIESSDVTLPTPTRTGYTFAGWYENADLSTGGVKTTIVSGTHENKTYYAKWTVNWKFMYNGDSYAEHTFDNSKEWTQSLDGNTTYWFRISDGAATVYRLAGASTMTSANCTDWNFPINTSTDCGIQTTAPGNYTFTLSDADPSTKVQISVTYPSSVTITLNLNGHGDNITWYAATGGTIPTPADPTASGFTFAGWYSDAGCNTPWNFSTTVNSATTLYAKWTQYYYYHEEWGDWAANQMTESADGNYWYWYTYKSGENRQFKIQQGGIWYGYTYNSPGFNCTDITNMNSSGNDWSVTDSRCAVNYNVNDRYYIIVYVPNTSINTTNNPIICASTSLPEASYDMSAGHKIYFDNSDRQWTNVYYRIGRACNNSVTQMTKVPGTQNLYQTTTAAYTNYIAFHIADNQATSGDNHSIYDVRPGSNNISNCINFQKETVSGDITLTPTTLNNTESSCSYYNVTETSGMKSHNASITAPTNGTITIGYSPADGSEATSFTSGNRDLAHTCILTISAEGATGYHLDVDGLTVNGDPFTSGTTHVLTADIVVAATFAANTNTAYTVKHYQQNIADDDYTEVIGDRQNLTGTTGASVTPAVNTYTGFMSPSTQTDVIAADGSLVISYYYTRNSYNLTWNLGGGTTTSAGTGIESGVSVNTTSSVKFGASITVPTVAKTGYNMTWSSTPAATMPAEATTYTANWSANNYIIALDNEGADSGKEGTESISVTYDAYTNLNGMPAITKPVKDGYLFGGYFVGDDGTGTQIIDADGNVIASVASYTSATKQWIYANNITLHAKWTKVHTVTWSVNDDTWSTGVVDGNTYVVNGQRVSALPTAPTKSDCDDSKVFVGWKALAIDGSSPSNPGGIFTTKEASPAITQDTTFYAVFADESGGDNTLVTNVSELTVGTQVYFYAETSDDPAFTAVMKAYESGNNVRAVSGSVSNNKLTPSDGACLYTIGTAVYSETTGYTFNDGTNYLYAASTTANHLKSRAAIEADGYAIFSISITDGVASISSIGNTSHGVLQFNKNNDTGNYTAALFACYASEANTRQNVQIFKKNPLTYSNYVTSCSSCDADATFTNTTPAVSDIDCTSATLTATGGLATLGADGCNVSDYGFVIGTTDDPAPVIGGSSVTKYQVGTTNPTTGADFSYDATGLTKGTHYYIRAYATNRHGTAYSSTQNFWTKNVSSIAITTPPTKTNYIVGETFDATGMVVTATMASGATEDVTSDVTYSTDALTAGTNKDFAINYTLCETDKSVNQKINVYTLSVSEGTNPSYGSYTVDGAVITVSLEAQKTFSFATTNCSTRDNGDGTYTVINVTGNATVVINYRDAVQVKVYYKVDGTTITSLTQDVYESSQTTLPTASALSSAMAAQGMALPDELYPNFIGWSETEFGAQTEDPTIVEGTPIITASKSYYAVYSNVEKIRIDESDITSTQYPSGEQTLTKSSKDFIYHYICKQSSNLQFKKNSSNYGYIYNNTAISNIAKIEIGASGDDDFVPVYAGSAANTISGSALTDEDISEYKYVYLFPSNTQYFIIKGDNSYTYKVDYIDIFYASSTVYYMTQFCTRYSITGASTGGTAVIVNGNTGGTLTSSHNELCEGKSLTLSATVNTQYSFGEWKIVKTGSDPEVDLTADLLGANKTSLTPPAFSMPGYGITVSATISEKTATAWSWTYNSAAIPDPMILYVGEVKQLDVTYTPDAAQLVSAQKNYTVTKESSPVAEAGKAMNYYKMRGAAGVTEETNATVTFSLNSLVQEVNVTVKPLPSARFEDNVHNAISTTVTATVSDGVVSLTKKTPTHADISPAPASGNACEKQHLHLIGWIDGDWEPFINYMNGGSRPSDSDITSATGYFYLPNADIDLSQKGGKTYYAVWGKADE